jgi:hypothetical protein
MAMSDAALRRERAIEQLIQRQAQKALQRSKTTIVGGEIVRTAPPQPTPSPFTGTAKKLGEGDDAAATPGPGMPHLARARQIKATIDEACRDTISNMKAADPQSPFVADVDAILSETAKLITQAPDELRAPTYEKRQMARLKELSECSDTLGDIRQHGQQVRQTATLAEGSPELARIDSVCAQAGSELRAAPGQRAAIKARSVASLDQVAVFATTRAAIEKALAEAVGAINNVAPGSVFLQDVEALRQQVAALVAQGSPELASNGFEADQIKRIRALPQCAAAYKEIRIRFNQFCDGLALIRDGAPQVADARSICTRAVASFRGAPESCDATKGAVLKEFVELEKEAKVSAAAYWEALVLEKNKGASRNSQKVGEALDALANLKRNPTASFEVIQTKLGVLVWPAASGSVKTGARARSGKSVFPTMTRTDATASGLTMGRAMVGAIKEAAGSKNINRRAGMRELFAGSITNARGGRTGYFHWHIFGDAQDNMIYDTAGVVLGFVGAHIDTNHVQGQQQAKNIERRTDEVIEIGVNEDGAAFEIVEG